jgi:hypothetical protein
MKFKSIGHAGDSYKHIEFSNDAKQRFVDLTEAVLKTYKKADGSFNETKLYRMNKKDVS